MTETAAGKRRRRLTLGLVMVALQMLVVAGYYCVESNRFETRAEARFRYEPLSGVKELPLVELVRHDGRSEPASQLLGRPVLLHFWATWCPPCREELADLLALADEEPRLQVVAVALDDDWEIIGKFFNGSIPLRVVREPSGLLVKAYEVGSLPDTYFLDRRGRAVLRFGGARKWRAAVARDTLAPHLEVKP